MISNQGTRTIRLQVDDVGCRACIADYEGMLAEPDGIHDVSIDYQEGIITILYDPAVIDRKGIYIHVRKLVRKATILSDS